MLNVPAEGLRGLVGIILIHSHKGAAVVGWEQGRGAAFKVLGSDADGPILSAPIPVLLQKFTVGLQLGYNSVHTMLAVYDQLTWMELLRVDTSGLVMGKDITLVGLQGEYTPTTTIQPVPGLGGDEAAHKRKPVRAITVSESFMVVEVSVYGGSLSVDVEMLTGAYGGIATVDQVLAGTVPCPHQLDLVVTAVREQLGRLGTAVAASEARVAAKKAEAEAPAAAKA
ncbi:hypothetical protein HYH02_001654 [Chlamydomonas schloesseri]|uniref:Uncharacterized protein n=1 Tax=Chlamydomonas schloesseri TaxID=2026947 RepID=A0A835WTM3_9CHLO|nr:hypothetical protein HYH02_001654 [Chlamydomonas schloesseri]|eukprot:KAG2453431.1 hypothetical protein HYH02_001654 [Chlamydomonas schloesseri]